jgi:hypothetical protein
MLKGKLENNLTKNRYSDSLKMGQLTLSQSKMRKGNDVVDEDDIDAVSTCVSQDQVTSTLHSDELFLRTKFTLHTVLISDR